jgi:hypothetical protein
MAVAADSAVLPSDCARDILLIIEKTLIVNNRR